MQSAQKYTEIIHREITGFPPEQLPQLARLLKLLRKDFASKRIKRGAKEKGWEDQLASFCGSVSSSEAFMSRKAEEKALER